MTNDQVVLLSALDQHVRALINEYVDSDEFRKRVFFIVDRVVQETRFFAEPKI